MNPERLPVGVASKPSRCGRNAALPNHRAPDAVADRGGNVRLSGLPVVAPANSSAAGAVGVLRITLKCASPEATFNRLGVDRLRFFLRGPVNQTLALYELLGAHAISVAYADNAVDPAPVIVPATAIRAGWLLPRGSAAAAVGTWLLRFPPVDGVICLPGEIPVRRLPRMDAKTLVSGGNRLEMFVYLDRTVAELERTVAQASMALGCVPLINLFRQRCEPISLKHMETEYRSYPMPAGPVRPKCGASSGSAKPNPTDRSVLGGHSTGCPTTIRSQENRGDSTMSPGGRPRPA